MISNSFRRFALSSLFATTLFVAGFIISPQQAEACRFGRIYFEPEEVSYVDEVNDPPKVEVHINTYECNGKNLHVSIIEADAGFDPNETVITEIISVQDDSIKYIQEFETGDLECDTEYTNLDEECDYIIGVVALEPGQTTPIAAFEGSDELEYNMIGSPDKAWIPGTLTTDDPDVDPGQCILRDLKIFEVDEETGSTTAILGQQSNTFYQDEERPLIQINAKLVGCQGKDNVFGPYATRKTNHYIHGPGGSVPIPALGAWKLKGTKEITQPELLRTIRLDTNQAEAFFSLKIRLGDLGCDGASCQIGFLTNKEKAIGAGCRFCISDHNEPPALEIRNNGYHLKYGCDGGCNTPWEMLSVTVTDEEGNPLDLYSNPFLKGYKESIEASPCYIPPDNPDSGELGTLAPNCYELLAPLPGLEALGVPFENEKNRPKLSSGAFTQKFSIGFWVNRMTMLLIGVIGLAAVVMIIIAGVQYMTTEAIGTKSGAKERIINSPIGLAIALSVFVILSTINPQLLDLDPDIETADLEFIFTSEHELDGDVAGISPIQHVLPSNVDLYCPKSGGADELMKIAKSFQGKTTYRWGAKGHDPAYTLPKKKELNRCTKDPDKTIIQCNVWCPEGTVCIDCSGYAFHLLKCAGLNAIPDGTANYVKKSYSRHLKRYGKKAAIDLDDETYEYEVAGSTFSSALSPGDLLYWPSGHVVIYLGDGMVTESASGVGRTTPGKAIRIDKLENRSTSGTPYIEKITDIIPVNAIP